jgi:hypothetical protein
MDLLGTFIDNHDNARFLRYAGPLSIFLLVISRDPMGAHHSFAAAWSDFVLSSLAATHHQWHERLQALPERHHLHPHGARHPHHLRTYNHLLHFSVYSFVPHFPMPATAFSFLYPREHSTAPSKVLLALSLFASLARLDRSID